MALPCPPFPGRSGAYVRVVESKIVVRCGKCGQQNRMAVTRIGDGPKCGACKTTLPPPGEPIDVTDEELPALLAESLVPVVVDFWAAWCGPCRMIAPTLEDLARHHAGKLLVVKLDVDENPRMAAAHDAKSIPLLVGFSRGKPIARQVGALPPAQLASWVESVVAAR